MVVVDENGQTLRAIPMVAEGDGYFAATDPKGKAGDRYQYRFGDSQGWPDPASRWQPAGVHGPSMVIDPAAYRWQDEKWTSPPLRDLVIYELHVGTFTPAGSFLSAIERLDDLVALGVNAIELMPVADFPGNRNWGYDGVMLYAPASSYGHPDEMRALVDAAHRRGLAVILDVVYNHFGPDGNYTSVYHDDYSDSTLQTPWGAALNYGAAPVRAFFLENAPYWMREFHLDGFRLDATHEIADRSTPHLLAEIASAVHSLGGFVIAEDERNEPRLLRPATAGGEGLDGVWADDFHHVVHVRLTGEREGYYGNYEGTAEELAQTIDHGWLYRGQVQPTNKKPRGGDATGLLPWQFIYCLTNHDQIGNRAFGERLSHLISPAAYRAASALLCLIPQTPLIFQGQEWAASTPFQFFTDHNPELGKLVTAGRRREFKTFAAFRDEALRETIPDPQARETFERSKIRWEERAEPGHAAMLRLYQEFLALRRELPVYRNRREQAQWQALLLNDELLALRSTIPSEDPVLIISDLRGGQQMPDLGDQRLGTPAGKKWQQSLSSNEVRFGGSGAEDFREPTTLIYRLA